MTTRRRHTGHHHRRNRSPGRSHQRPPVTIRADAEPRLKAVFDQIGVPEAKPFRPDAFQTEAVRMTAECDCLVTAPTGAGKTWIAEQTIGRCLARGGRVWYASPLKALTNAKYQEFGERFGPDRVGILTGDRKENVDAPVITGTTEILRNQLYDAMHHGRTLTTDEVILDEAHYLGDTERGVVWEEIMIYLPARIRLLLLSATVGNADAIAGWLESIRETPCRVVRETQRPVPLFGLFFHPSGRLMPILEKTKPGQRQRMFKKVRDYSRMTKPPRLSADRQLPPFGRMIAVLRKYNLLPAIFFLKSRADCDRALTLCTDTQLGNSGRGRSIAARIDQLAGDNPHLTDHRQRQFAEHHAVAAHHSGHLPGWKLLVESLLTDGALDAVFATSTVAAGVNFPARTVAFLNSDRFNGTEFMPLTATEFHQMTGRAGRRGMDRIGFALAVPGRFLDLPQVAKLMTTDASPVTSQIRINFSMVLNLLLSHSPDQVGELLSRSFAAYQHDNSSKGQLKRTRRAGEKLNAAFHRHLTFLQQHGYVAADGQLTEAGQWASQLRVDQPLLIAEGLRKDLLPADDPGLLAALMAAFVFDRDMDDRYGKNRAAAPLRKAYRTLRRGLSPFALAMHESGFAIRPLLLTPAAAVYAWLNGWSWEATVTLSALEEGNLVMLMLRTADHLRHVAALADVFPESSASAKEAVSALLKPPVLMT